MSTAALDVKECKPSRTGYTPNNAFCMATIAKLVYMKRDSGEPDKDAILEDLRLLDEGFEEVAPFDRNSSQSILVRHKRYAVAAFRGTDELADWWDNLKAISVSHPLGSVHQGFQDALMDVWPAMRTKLREFRNNTRGLPLWLTGHSLGGAMATLAAAQLIHADEPFYGVYTFGQPRCGSRDFARTFNNEAKDRFFRFQNNSDIVTRAPARIMGYSHVGRFIHISSDGDLDWDIGWWYQFVDTVKGAVDDLGEKGIDAVKDHEMDEYLGAIKKWGNREPES